MFKKYFKWINGLFDKIMYSKIAGKAYQVFQIHLSTIIGFCNVVKTVTSNSFINNCAFISSFGSIVAIPIYAIYSILNRKYVRGSLLAFTITVVIHHLVGGYNAGYFDNFIKSWNEEVINKL